MPKSNPGGNLYVFHKVSGYACMALSRISAEHSCPLLRRQLWSLGNNIAQSLSFSRYQSLCHLKTPALTSVYRHELFDTCTYLGRSLSFKSDKKTENELDVGDLKDSENNSRSEHDKIDHCETFKGNEDRNENSTSKKRAMGEIFALRRIKRRNELLQFRKASKINAETENPNESDGGAQGTEEKMVGAENKLDYVTNDNNDVTPKVSQSDLTPVGSKRGRATQVNRRNVRDPVVFQKFRIKIDNDSLNRLIRSYASSMHGRSSDESGRRGNLVVIEDIDEDSLNSSSGIISPNSNESGIALITGTQSSSFAPSNSALVIDHSSNAPILDYPKLFALGIYKKPLFPGFYQVIQIDDDEILQMMINIKKGTSLSGDSTECRQLGGFLTKSSFSEQRSDATPTYKFGVAASSNDDEAQKKDAGRINTIEEIYSVGTVLSLVNFLPNNSLKGGQVIVMPLRRVKITGLSAHQSNFSPLLTVDVVYPKDEVTDEASQTQKAMHTEIIATMKELLKTSFVYKDYIEHAIKFNNLENYSRLFDVVGGISFFARREELQAVLNEENIEKRLSIALEIIKKDLEFAKLQVKVRASVEEKLSKEQRKYMLNEQLRFIKKELGVDKDDKQTIIQQFLDILNEKQACMVDEAIKAIEHECSRMSSLDPSSSEFNVCRTYVEWLTNHPWGVYTTDNSDIKKAEDILNADHYGLEDVKERILEFIAVNVLKGNVHGKIICLVGPPGVGKTSVGKSIAKALERKFYHFSLGGLYDVSELRGHRRTYVGAMPGKIIQAFKTTQSLNPVILLDEIDKLGRDFRGDPASALLEILDPCQNVTFRDNYLDVPIDLSRVLFVCTANTPDSIPGPLLDRFDIIRLAGYVFEEKMCIAKQYLIPSCITECGVSEDKLQIDHEVLAAIVKNYAREAGVRQLLKFIDKIYRKAALKIVRNNAKLVEVGLDNLSEFIGQPQHFSERLFFETPPGVVIGLAWTAIGGATLFVEAVGRVKEKKSKAYSKHDSSDSDSEYEDKRPEGIPGSLKVTGQLGAVMSESSQIAFTYSKLFMNRLDPTNQFLEKAILHLHVPEGATPKDGPSAGVTMTTALLSLALSKPVQIDVAMTGEMTLSGKVLKIGGVKEKVIAAKRDLIKTLIFPKANVRDFMELQNYIKEGLVAYFCENYEQVFNVAFGNDVTGIHSIHSEQPEILKVSDKYYPSATEQIATQ